MENPRRYQKTSPRSLVSTAGCTTARAICLLSLVVLRSADADRESESAPIFPFVWRVGTSCSLYGVDVFSAIRAEWAKGGFFWSCGCLCGEKTCPFGSGTLPLKSKTLSGVSVPIYFTTNREAARSNPFSLKKASVIGDRRIFFGERAPAAPAGALRAKKSDGDAHHRDFDDESFLSEIRGTQQAQPAPAQEAPLAQQTVSPAAPVPEHFVHNRQLLLVAAQEVAVRAVGPFRRVRSEGTHRKSEENNGLYAMRRVNFTDIDEISKDKSRLMIGKANDTRKHGLS